MVTAAFVIREIRRNDVEIFFFFSLFLPLSP
jgi:hypothetical protein